MYNYLTLKICYVSELVLYSYGTYDLPCELNLVRYTFYVSFTTFTTDLRKILTSNTYFYIKCLPSFPGKFFVMRSLTEVYS